MRDSISTTKFDEKHRSEFGWQWGSIVKARGPIRLKKLASMSFYNDRRTHTKCWEPIRSTKEEIIITSKLQNQSLLMRYFVVHLWLKILLFICVPTTLAKRILFPNHMNKKLVGGKHNVLVHYADASAPDSEGAVRCNTFKWDILLCVHIHFKSLKCVLCVSLHCEIPVGLGDKGI